MTFDAQIKMMCSLWRNKNVKNVAAPNTTEIYEPSGFLTY
jgi:hypothetical protein